MENKIARLTKKRGKEKFSFEDWVANDLWLWGLEIYPDKYISNDSMGYLYLTDYEIITFEDLNKIQKAQSEAYEYMIQYTLEANRKHFERETSETLDLKKVVEIKIKKLENFINENEEVYYEVILPRKERGIKLGATFITPEEYAKFKSIEHLDAYMRPGSRYKLVKDGKIQNFPTPEQKLYAEMEVKVLWLKWLKEYSEKLQRNGNPNLVSQWQGTDEQKKKLFDGLAAKDLIEDNKTNRNNFLNNRIVQWKGYDRTLYYLLEELKSQKFKLLPRTIELSPFIALNFINQKGQCFKNINQNKSGTNINANSKPRNGDDIDSILKTLYTTLR